MAVTGFLGRALMDPSTGLPNIPYFMIVQEWEERRARRRGYEVRVLTMVADCDDEALLRSLSWRLCQEVRNSDLIASEGRSSYRILLTSPDAENAESIKARIQELAKSLNQDHPHAHLELQVTIQPVAKAAEVRGPCEPPDTTAFDREDRDAPGA
jgi:GGDEF domain-containing protein